MIGEKLRASEVAERLPHSVYTRAQLVLIFGQRGFGKTTLLHEYLTTGPEPRVLALDPFDDFRYIAQADLDLALRMLRHPDPCRVRVRPPFVDSFAYAQDLYARAAEEKGLRNLLLVMDEINLWTRPYSSPEFDQFILQGRRLGIRIVMAGHLLSFLPETAKGQATQLVFFHLARPRDLAVVADWSDKATAKAVSQLEVGECIYVNV